MALGVKSSKKDIDKYFAEAKDWDFDRAREYHNQKRLAYMIGGGGVLFGLAMLAWHVTMPLESVKPYVIRVDQQTGATDVITHLTKTRNITTDEAVNKFFLSDYVRNREAWIPDAAKDMLRRTKALSVPSEQEKLNNLYRPQNANNPANMYQSGETVSAAVTHITFINPRVAQVRFQRRISRMGNVPDEVTNWISTVNFKYVDRPTTEAGRLDNPLGFQVVSYRSDPEVGQ